jgi:hypothetical protein
MHGLIAPVATLLETTERHCDIAAEVIVDSHRTNAPRSGNLVRRIDVVAPARP